MKRSPQLSRVISYIKRRIGKTWELGTRIDSVTYIAKDIGVCYTTARKAIKVLCKQGLLENRGTGFFVIGRPNLKLSTILGKLDNLKRAAASIKTAKMLSEGGMWDGQEIAVIARTDNTIKIFYPITIMDITLDIDSIKNTISNPITAQNVIDNKLLLDQFHKQQQVKEHANVLFPRLKQLNIQL